MQFCYIQGKEDQKVEGGIQNQKQTQNEKQPTKKIIKRKIKSRRGFRNFSNEGIWKNEMYVD